MAEKLLDDSDVGPGHQSSGEGVSEYVGINCYGERIVCGVSDDSLYLTDSYSVVLVGAVKSVLFRSAFIR